MNNFTNSVGIPHFLFTEWLSIMEVQCADMDFLVKGIPLNKHALYAFAFEIDYTFIPTSYLIERILGDPEYDCYAF